MDWKLNQLLSASRASKQYVTRSVTEAVANDKAFARWVPRQLSTATDRATDDAARDDKQSVDGKPDINTSDYDDGKNPDASLTFEPIDPALNMLTDEELEDIRKAAFKQGKDEAGAELDAQIGAAERRFVDLITQLAETSVDLQEVKTTVAELAIFIAQQVIRAELTISAQWLDTLVEQCLQEIRLHGNQGITVSLSESDFAEHSVRLAERHELVKFTGNKALQRGDIEVSMGATHISEQIKLKLALVSENLLTTLTTPAHTDAPAIDPGLNGDAK